MIPKRGPLLPSGFQVSPLMTCHEAILVSSGHQASLLFLGMFIFDSVAEKRRCLTRRLWIQYQFLASFQLILLSFHHGLNQQCRLPELLPMGAHPHPSLRCCLPPFPKGQGKGCILPPPWGREIRSPFLLHLVPVYLSGTYPANI